MNDRKGITSFVFCMRDKTFIWCSKKQSIIILSISEAKNIVTTSFVCHFICLRRLLKELQML